jgi:hypothetical protein
MLHSIEHGGKSWVQSFLGFDQLFFCPLNKTNFLEKGYMGKENMHLLLSSWVVTTLIWYSVSKLKSCFCMAFSACERSVLVLKADC